MTAYVKCAECGDGVPWYYAWVWHPNIAMHPGCAKDRWDEEGAGAIGPALREALSQNQEMVALSLSSSDGDQQ